MITEHYVYRHIRLDKNETFYIGIGKTKNYSRAYSKKSRNPLWKNIVAKTDYTIEIVMDNLTEFEAREKEKELVKLYGRIDIKSGTLSNLTDGGEGTIGIVRTKEWVDAMIKRNKEYKHTPEAIEKIRESAKNISNETRDKMSEAKKGKSRNFSEEALESLKFHGSNISEETRAKRSKALKGRVFSEETKQKMRESAIKRCEQKRLLIEKARPSYLTA